jgi:glycosyltransferase involved in cell wall biosynthesis
MSQPLLSFYVIAYNQAAFVRDAIRAAFAQTWNPLEIILSDDCSEDDTYSIMEEESRQYQGSHTLRLNRNRTRLGVGGHINAVLRMARGEFIVASAGDDVSVPHRTERLYARYRDLKGQAPLVYSNIVEIDRHGAVLQYRDFAGNDARWSTVDEPGWSLSEHLDGRALPVHGASFGYSKNLFSAFGELAAGVVFEDDVLNWRAELLGMISLIREGLVLHRNHPGQITNPYDPSTDLREAVWRRKAVAYSRVAALRQNIRDTQIVCNHGDLAPRVAATVIAALRPRLKKEETLYTSLYAPWPRRLAVVVKHAALFGCQEDRKTLLLRALLPLWAYTATLRLVRWLRKGSWLELYAHRRRRNWAGSNRDGK